LTPPTAVQLDALLQRADRLTPDEADLLRAGVQQMRRELAALRDDLYGITGARYIADALIEAEASDELKEKVLGELIGNLQQEDWDTELDSLQSYLDDPAIVRAFASNGVHWPN
jgi:hypothetical protein